MKDIRKRSPKADGAAAVPLRCASDSPVTQVLSFNTVPMRSVLQLQHLHLPVNPHRIVFYILKCAKNVSRKIWMYEAFIQQNMPKFSLLFCSGVPMEGLEELFE